MTRLLIVTALVFSAAAQAQTPADRELELRVAKLELEAQRLMLKSRELAIAADKLLIEAKALRIKQLGGEAPTPLTKKPETQPETKPEAKPATKPEAKPATKPETQPATKPKLKPGQIRVTWMTPQVQRTQGKGKFTPGKATLSGTNAKGNGYSMIFYGNPMWQDYVFQFELKQTAGELGLFARGGAKGAQQPALLRSMGIKTDPNHWYKAEVLVQGAVVRIRVVGKDGKVRQRVMRNLTFSNGLFGFVMHDGCTFELRNLRAAVIKSRPL